MSCGGGSDVEILVHKLADQSSAKGAQRGDHRPLVFLDFDRTFCSTKNGADPLVGSHKLDSDLLGVACNTALARVHILTRNSHTASIQEILRRHGVPTDVSVISVPRGSKGEVIRDQLQQAQSGVQCLFVDDDLAEHCDPVLATGICAEAVHRLLFTRVC